MPTAVPAIGLAVLLCCPEIALAHDAVDGAGPFVAGVLHPLLVPAHLMTLLALGLWIGRLPLVSLRLVLGAFGGLLAAGLALSGTVGGLPIWLTAAVGLVLGAVLAAGRRPHQWIAAAGGGVAAFLIGLDSVPDAAAAPVDAAAMLAGSWIGAHLLLLNLVALVTRLRRPWTGTAIRVAGAWIAAISLLVLTFALRG